MSRGTAVVSFVPLLLSMGCTPPEDALYRTFKNPPAGARPFVRRWWYGDCVDEKEILREPDVMKNAGIGGVEINPIAVPSEAVQTVTACLAWFWKHYRHPFCGAQPARSRRDNDFNRYGVLGRDASSASPSAGNGWPSK